MTHTALPFIVNVYNVTMAAASILIRINILNPQIPQW
jgi:hypothetical protein